MKRTVNEDHLDGYILSNGKRIAANGGLISISNDLMEIDEGYDGILYIEGDEEHNEDALTIEERLEITEYMINLWSSYKEKLSNEKDRVHR